MIDYIILEDERFAYEEIKRMITILRPDYHLKAWADGVERAVSVLTDGTPDLLIADIRLSDGLCFDVFERKQTNVPVIFTTAYDEFALQAFRVNSIDYLLKPINADDLQKALDKLKQLGAVARPQTGFNLQDIMRTLHQEESYKSHFLVPVKGDKFVPVNVDDIMYFYIKEGEVKAVTQNAAAFTFQQTLDELADMLHPRKFFRANRQYIISRKAVTSVSLWFGGRLSVQLNPPAEEKVIISKARVPAFKEWF